MVFLFFFFHGNTGNVARLCGRYILVVLGRLMQEDHGSETSLC